MQNNIEQIVDFRKLRESNSLGKKWADRFGVSVNFYLVHMIDVKNNYEKYKNQLEQKYRSQFSKDYKKMWYALEVEDVLIRQYEPCIHKLAIKFCKDDSKMDEYISLGMRTVRQSVWQFRTHKSKASFFTFVYNGLFQRLRGFRFKQIKAKKSRKNVITYNEVDLRSNHSDNHFSLANHPEKEKFHYYEDEEIWYRNMLEKLINSAVLSSDEKVLLDMFMRRKDDFPDWCHQYREKYPKKDGGVMSRQAVHNKLQYIQKKIWIAYRRMQYNANKFAI